MKKYVDNRELKVKKILNKYIKKPLCYSAISALLLTETSIASVYELTDEHGKKVTLMNAEDKGKREFERLVNKFSDGNLTNEYKAGKRVGVDESTGKAEGNHKEKYTPANLAGHRKDPASGFYGFDSQMLGAAVWFPDNNTNEKQQVYVARKIDYNECDKYGYEKARRNGTFTSDKTAAVTTGYDEGSPDSFKKRTDVDHTERQLVAAILSENRLNKNSGGTMCIYTKGHPCINDQSNDAGKKSCVNYYKELAKAYSDIEFHVYFAKDNTISETDINTIREETKASERDLYVYEHLKTNTLFKKKALQNTVFHANFRFDSAYLVYLLKHLNGHGINGTCKIAKDKALYKIDISCGSAGSLTFSKVSSDIECDDDLSNAANIIKSKQITATDKTVLLPVKNESSLVPVIPLEDFNLAYNGGQNNLEFKLLGITQEAASAPQETQG